MPPSDGQAVDLGERAGWAPFPHTPCLGCRTVECVSLPASDAISRGWRKWEDDVGSVGIIDCSLPWSFASVRHSLSLKARKHSEE